MTPLAWVVAILVGGWILFMLAISLGSEIDVSSPLGRWRALAVASLIAVVAGGIDLEFSSWDLAPVVIFAAIALDFAFTTFSKQGRAARRARARATIGDTITLQGKTERETRVAVTVLSLVDPWGATSSLPEIDDNKRRVAVEIRLRNVGPTHYDQRPDDDARLLYGKKGYLRGGWIDHAEKPAEFRYMPVNPGETRAGLVVFLVPKDETPTTFVFNLEAGSASDTGRWSLSSSV